MERIIADDWTRCYCSDTNGFVSFNVGAMPGCYKDSGGYLQSTNARFKEIYAQLLMLAANGGMRASVLYTQNPPTNNWGDCYVDGIYLRPD